MADLKSLLLQTRKYVETAGREAEAKHDDPDNGLYMDYAQYVVFTGAAELLKSIDEAISEESPAEAEIRRTQERIKRYREGVA